VSGQRDRRQPSRGEGTQVPRAHFEEDLPCGRRAEAGERLQPCELRRRPVAKERMAAPALVAPGKADQSYGHEDAREAGGESRTADAKRGKTQFAVDEHPVEEPVDEIGPDIGRRDDVDLAHALQITAGCAVEQQRQRAPQQDAKITRRRNGHLRSDTEADKSETGQAGEQHERRCGDAGEIDALRQPAMAFVVILAAVGLRDQRVEAEQKAHAEERWCVVDGVADGDRADSRRAKLAHHDGVDHALRHPAQLAEDDGNCERDHGAQFASPVGVRGRHFSNLQGAIRDTRNDNPVTIRRGPVRYDDRHLTGEVPMRKLSLILILCAAASMAAAQASSIYDFTMKSIDGQQVSLSSFKGKVVLLVNVASKCGFTPQYSALESVYEKYKDRGLVIVGVPANNFAQQEPGTDAEIKQFCTNKYNVSFPMMSKVSVLGDDKTPLYVYLTDKSTDPKFAGDIKWNFTKFLFDRNGNLIDRFEPPVKPDAPEVISAIEGALGS
jgi:glutathione peroxidase